MDNGFYLKEPTPPAAFSKRKVHSNEKQPAAGGLPRAVALAARPIPANSGVVHLLRILSYDLECLSYVFHFLSYNLCFLSFDLKFLSHASALSDR